MADEELKFTGERFMPDAANNKFLEHQHRYRVAMEFARGKRVLDIASGEGYGSALLALVAAHVVGIDISRAAVRHAQKTYRGENLQFMSGSCTQIPLPNQSIDLVVSFETLEHIDGHDEFFREIKRILHPQGLLIISAADKRFYAEAAGYVNPFHVKELHRDEFVDLLSRHFLHFTLHGQKIGFGSLIASLDGRALSLETESTTGRTETGLIAPMYLIAIASDDPAKISPISSLFSQDIQSSEPVLKRLEFERARWERDARKAIDQLSEAIVRFGREVRTMLLNVMLTYAQAHLSLVLGFWSVSKKKKEHWRNKALRQRQLLYSRIFDRLTLDFFRGIQDSDQVRETRQVRKNPVRVTVSAIVPNYNHERFLRQRLDSIIDQTYAASEIIVLDDASTDGSRLIIEEYKLKYPGRIQTIYNDYRVGNVFNQWKKGLEAATGDLVWICESDDFCASDFLEKLVPLFSNESLTIAFGKIHFVDDFGKLRPGLDKYREACEAGIWDAQVIRPAYEWFAGAFSVRNLIANVGGSVWRRFDIGDEVWRLAKSYKVMGDWYLYFAISGGGQIGYEPKAISYFRQHEKNTSVIAQKDPGYYKEYFRIMSAFRDRWNIPNSTVARFVESSRAVFRSASPVAANFDELLSFEELKVIRPSQIHVLMCFLGFVYGGGELFPICLANALHRKGVVVSMLSLWDKQMDLGVRRMLDPGIPVYSIDQARRMGIRDFIKRAGVSIIHSHIASGEMVMLDEGGVEIPYVVTLHGSYEAMEINIDKIERWAKAVSMFVYTADKNLQPLRSSFIPPSKLRKLHNAMPRDERSCPMNRRQLGIPDHAVVFTFVARSAAGKGWTESVRAFQKLQCRHPDLATVLLMIGDGEETKKARLIASDNPHILFLGFQDRIPGLYRISDVALVPTRFSGESFPLCIIQAMQVGLPIIATDIGEIKTMTAANGEAAGVIISSTGSDTEFLDNLVEAMEAMLDQKVRSRFSSVSAVIGKTFDIDALSETYLGLYKTVISNVRSPSHRANNRVLFGWRQFQMYFRRSK